MPTGLEPKERIWRPRGKCFLHLTPRLQEALGYYRADIGQLLWLGPAYTLTGHILGPSCRERGGRTGVWGRTDNSTDLATTPSKCDFRLRGGWQEGARRADSPSPSSKPNTVRKGLSSAKTVTAGGWGFCAGIPAMPLPQRFLGVFGPPFLHDFRELGNKACWEFNRWSRTITGRCWEVRDGGTD